MPYAERFQAKWNRNPTGYVEDVAVCTIHFSTPSDGALGNTVRASVESAFSTFISSLAAFTASYASLVEYRWYNQMVAPTHSPLLRTTTPTPIVGTSSNVVLPQQSCSVTLQTADRARWGRFYLPAWSPTLGVGARIASATVDTVANNAKTFLDAAKVAGALPVVWSPKGGVGPPAFAPGTYEVVTNVRCDDILDVIRSRRWQGNPYRKIVTLA